MTSSTTVYHDHDHQFHHHERPHRPSLAPLPLAIGINAASRAVSRGTALAVVVDTRTQPALLWQHLVAQCLARTLPVAALPGDAAPLSDALHTHRAAAVALLQPFGKTNTAGNNDGNTLGKNADNIVSDTGGNIAGNTAGNLTSNSVGKTAGNLVGDAVRNNDVSEVTQQAQAAAGVQQTQVGATADTGPDSPGTVLAQVVEALRSLPQPASKSAVTGVYAPLTVSRVQGENKLAKRLRRGQLTLPRREQDHSKVAAKQQSETTAAAVPVAAKAAKVKGKAIMAGPLATKTTMVKAGALPTPTAPGSLIVTSNATSIATANTTSTTSSVATSPTTLMATSALGAAGKGGKRAPKSRVVSAAAAESAVSNATERSPAQRHDAESAAEGQLPPSKSAKREPGNSG